MTPEEYKAAGNQAFSAGKFEEAIKHFTSAIEQDASNHVLYSNRSAAHASLGDFDSALSDALKTSELAPNWAKTYSRLAVAYHGLDRLSEARDSIKRGLEIEPTNSGLLKAQEDLESNSSANMFTKIFKDPAIWTKIAANPRISHHLANADFCRRLTTAIQNPQLAMSLISNDQELLMVVLALFGVDVAADSGNDAAKQPFSTGAEPAPAAEESNSSASASDAAAAAAAAARTAQKVNAEPAEPESEESRTAKLVQLKKEEGNAAYRKKDFENALTNYTEAFKISGESDPSLLTNMAAVHFERKEWNSCIERCQQAIDLARSNRADYVVVSRALTRMGRAYEKNDDLEAAKQAYKDALVEHRTADTLSRLNNVEKEITARAKAAYQDADLSAAARERGNVLFAAQKYPEAIVEYTEAIKRAESDVRAYANRSACYLKLGAPSEAQRDAEKAIEINPDYIKGYVRKVNVLLIRRELSKAIDVCNAAKARNVAKENATEAELALIAKQAVEIDDLLYKCYMAVAEQNSRLQNSKADSKEREEVMRNAMRDPEIASILRDPQMNSILEQMQSDPRAASAFMADPIVAAKIKKLMASGILTQR